MGPFPGTKPFVFSSALIANIVLSTLGTGTGSVCRCYRCVSQFLDSSVRLDPEPIIHGFPKSLLTS
jgi:hypothetical protein